VTSELTPRARRILAEVEREAQRPRRPAARPPAAVEPLPLDGPLLAALELSVAGLERAEVGQRLSADHGVADPHELLDAVFGPGSAPQARLGRGPQPGGPSSG
jgi:hypothetical protein